MERYIINCLSFNNKNEITDKCREIVNNNIGKDLSGTDLEFMIQIFKFHENKDKLICAKRIFVDLDSKYQNNPCCYIEYITGEINDISWTKCILGIPFGENNKIDWKMPFGKYTGESLYDIFDKDPQYLQWVVNKVTTRDLKVKINQMIRYGHIPYNPIAHQHAIEKKKKSNREFMEGSDDVSTLNNEKPAELDYDNIDLNMDYDWTINEHH